MKTIILFIALFAIPFFSFSQTHSKQEIMDWICGKLIKYGQFSCAPRFEITSIRQDKNLLIVSSKSFTNPNQHNVANINLNNLSGFNIDFNYDHYNCFSLEGNKLTSVKSWDYNGEETNMVWLSYSFADFNWNMEENLQERMKKALNDLVSILRKERQGNTEPY